MDSLRFRGAAALWLLPALWARLGPLPPVEGFDAVQVRAFIGSLAARFFVAWCAWGAWRVLRQRKDWPALVQRHVGAVSARSLAYTRIVVCGVLLANVLWEDLPSSALLPAEMRRPVGLTSVLSLFGEAWMGSAPVLASVQIATAALLGLGLVGLRARWTLPLAALAYLIFGGLLRQYFKFYHTGLTPLFLLVALCTGPSADAWSLDAWLRQRRGEPAPARVSLRYGWTRYAVLFCLAAAYFEAGLSKLVNAGPFWWDPARMRGIFYADSLNPMQFDFDGGLWLAPLPDFAFGAMGLVALLGELAMGSLLFAGPARLIAPAVMIGMHLGILFTQNVLFFDLLVLLTLPYAWAWFDRRDAVAASRTPGSSDAKRGPTRPQWALAASMLAPWVVGAEFYPWTAWQMYSHAPADGTLTYYRLAAIDAEGRAREVRPEVLVPALRDARHRRVLQDCFSSRTRRGCDAFLETIGALRARHTGEAPRAMEAQRWEWRFLEAPDDPDHGEATATHRVVVRPPK